MAFVLVLLIAFVRCYLPHPWGFIPIWTALVWMGRSSTTGMKILTWVLMTWVEIWITRVLYSSDYGMGLVFALQVTMYGAVLFAPLGKKFVSSVVTVQGLTVGYFLLSNWLVWHQGDMYSHNLVGLQTCYVAALPFYRSAYVADTIASLAIFGVIAYSKRRVRVWQTL